MKESRIETGHRLELVNNRLAYLTNEAEKIDEELIVLRREKELLDSLNDLYSESKDIVDQERVRIIEPLFVSSGATNEDVILGLLDTGPSTRQELISASEFSAGAVSSALHRLIKKRVVERIEVGVYRKASTPYTQSGVYICQ